MLKYYDFDLSCLFRSHSYCADSWNFSKLTDAELVQSVHSLPLWVIGYALGRAQSAKLYNFRSLTLKGESLTSPSSRE